MEFVLALGDATVGELLATGAKAAADRPDRDPDEVALVLHSSGTTSTPKGHRRTRATRCATRPRASPAAGSSPRDDVSLVVCEFGFVGALVFGYFPVLLLGAHRRAA